MQPKYSHTIFNFSHSVRNLHTKKLWLIKYRHKCEVVVKLLDDLVILMSIIHLCLYPSLYGTELVSHSLWLALPTTTKAKKDIVFRFIIEYIVA
jgi:hypothetical protein